MTWGEGFEAILFFRVSSPTDDRLFFVRGRSDCAAGLFVRIEVYWQVWSRQSRGYRVCWPWRAGTLTAIGASRSDAVS
jgi:hypothetical protein